MPFFSPEGEGFTSTVSANWWLFKQIDVISKVDYYLLIRADRILLKLKSLQSLQTSSWNHSSLERQIVLFQRESELQCSLFLHRPMQFDTVLSCAHCSCQPWILCHGGMSQLLGLKRETPLSLVCSTVLRMGEGKVATAWVPFFPGDYQLLL